MGLVIKDDPRTGEGLADYFIRLCEINHYESPRWIGWIAGVETTSTMYNVNFIFKDKDDLAQLSEATGVSADELLPLAFYPDPKTKGANYLAADMSVPIYSIHKAFTKVCPHCLTAKGFSKKYWSISLYTVCAEHNCLLLDRCPSCNRKISLMRKSVNRCICGFDFRNAQTLKGSSGCLSVARRIENFEENNLTMTKQEHRALAELSLYNYARLLFFILGQIAGIFDTSGKYFALSIGNTEMHSLLKRAVAVFDNWPHNFHGFLDRLQKNPGIIARDTGILKDFGTFYRGLYEVLTEPEFDFMRNAFQDYLETHWRGGHIRKLKHLNGCSRKYITKAEAVKLLGVRDSCIDRYVKTGQLKGIVRTAGSRRLFLIERSSAYNLKRKMDSGLSLKGASYLLGIGHESVVDLVAHGHLSCLKCPADGYAFWLISPESIDNLMRMVSSKISDKSGLEQVSFYKAIRMVSSQGISIGAFMDMVVNGTISPSGEKAERGLQKYCFEKGDLEKIIKESVSANRNALMTVEEVANLARIKYEVLSQWVDRGFIAVEKVKEGRKRRRYITLESLDMFRRNYVLCSALAKEFGVSSKRLLEVYSRKGVSPISGPTIDGARQYLFRGEDVVVPLLL